MVEDPAANYDWFMSQWELRNRYAGQVVILHDRKVLGSGTNYREAEESMRAAAAAENRKLPEHSLLYVHVPLPADLDILLFDDPWEGSTRPPNAR
jgi:hypothetical protein